MERYKDKNLTPAERAQDLLSQMTLKEKIDQLNIIRGVEYALKPDKRYHCSVEYDSGFDTEKLKGIFGDRAPGFIHDVYSNPKTINTLQKFFIENSRLHIPVIITGEALHGVGAVGTSNFPVPLCLAAGFDEENTKNIGKCIAAEARSLGINEILAPNLDVARDPRWGRSEETFGEDTCLAEKMAYAIVSGESHDGDISKPDAVICEPKHFVAHGASEGGANCQHVRIGERELYESYLPVFKSAIDAGAKNIMSAYHAIDGTPMCVNYHLLTEVLKNELGLPGYIRSDWGSIVRLDNLYHMVESRDDCMIRTLNAGLDTQGCFEYEPEHYNKLLLSAVESGKLPLSRINDAVRRVLTVKFEAGLFENPYTDEALYLDTVSCKKHDDISLKAAQKGIILLKNDNEILPLTPEKYSSVALIGPLSKKPAEGGYSAIATRHISGILEELESAVGENIKIMHENGCDIIRQEEYSYKEDQAHLVRQKRERIDADMDAAVKLAEQCDLAVIVCGDTPEICNEGIDRSTLSLYGDQPELIRRVAAVGKPVVLVLMNGRPAVLSEQAVLCDSIVCCWHGGDFASKAAVDALTGKINPGGRVPMSFPSGEGRVPCYYSMFPGGSDRGYVEGDKKALYPFGFGLSYTTFEYGELTVEQKDRYSFDAYISIKNSGKVKGDEVVQLYLSDPISNVATPEKRLIGFKRLTLEPGEEKIAHISFGFDQLKIYLPNTGYTVDPGEYIITAGASSDAIARQVKINVD